MFSLKQLNLKVKKDYTDWSNKNMEYTSGNNINCFLRRRNLNVRGIAIPTKNTF